MDSLMTTLLKALAGGGIRSTTDLARELRVNQVMVDMMTEELAGRGYLAPVSGECGASCSGCSASAAPRGACGPGSGPSGAAKLLVLTPKGRRILQESPAN